jgi:putative oxidoreductase
MTMPDGLWMALPISPDLAGLVGRLVLGAIFIAHGWPKVKDVRKTQEFVKGTGWPGGETFALLFTYLEFFGGIALILGLLTQIVAFLFFLEMIATTIFSKTKLNKKFILGYELDVAYGAFALVLAFLGPGAWSLDRILTLA